MSSLLPESTAAESHCRTGNNDSRKAEEGRERENGKKVKPIDSGDNSDAQNDIFPSKI